MIRAIERGGSLLALLATLQQSLVAQPCFLWTDPGAVGPDPMADHAMVFDSRRGVSVLHGAGTWEWNGAQWSQGSGGPSRRTEHAMAYDSLRGVTVLFGGLRNTCLGDTWEWDGTSWSLRSTTGPRPRRGAALAFDEVRGVVVLFGGLGCPPQLSELLGDTWEWDGESWSQRASTGPRARWNHALTFSAADGVTLLFGGQSNHRLADTWGWNGTKWTLFLDDSGILPRANHQLAYDSQHGVPVLFGGESKNGVLGDAWEWDGSRWWKLRPPGMARTRHAMVYDSWRDTMVLFGGTWISGGPLAKIRESERVVPPVGDLNCDGCVDLVDLSEILAAFGECDQARTFDRYADLNADGCIDLSDLAALLGHFGHCE